MIELIALNYRNTLRYNLFSKILSQVMLACLALNIFGCSAYRIEDTIKNTPLTIKVITTEHFKHKVLSKQANDGSHLKRAPLHIYIEGDGKPWLHSRRISLDPSPKKTIMLSLMLQDESQSVYLGRPCYFQTKDPLCTPKWWTNARYSEKVVQSMNLAISLVKAPGRSIVLIGHSGGGTLATLIAARRQDVTALITIAANMDTQAWASYHEYSPLTDSLNPAALPSLPDKIKQVHLVGEDDTNTPPEMLIAALHRQHAQINVIPSADHNCCWETIWPTIWPTILKKIRRPKKP